MLSWLKKIIKKLGIPKGIPYIYVSIIKDMKRHLYNLFGYLQNLSFDTKTEDKIYNLLEKDFSQETCQEIWSLLHKLTIYYGEMNDRVFRLNMYFEDWIGENKGALIK